MVQCQNLFLSKLNHQKHLLLAQCFKHWEVEDWHTVYLTDESSMQHLCIIFNSVLFSIINI